MRQSHQQQQQQKQMQFLCALVLPVLAHGLSLNSAWHLSSVRDGINFPGWTDDGIRPRLRLRNLRTLVKFYDENGHSSYPETETTSESWLGRTGYTLLAFVTGCVFIIIAVPTLWFNEEQVAKVEGLIGNAEQEFVSVKTISGEQIGDLVYVSGGSAHAGQTLTSETFNVEMRHGLRLRASVEVYQWQEFKHEEERKWLGSGAASRITYTYEKVWSSKQIDTMDFAEREAMQPSKPEAEMAQESPEALAKRLADLAAQMNRKNKHPVKPGIYYTNCGRVTYALDGSDDSHDFFVPSALVSQLNDFQSAHGHLGTSSIKSRNNGTECTLKDGDEYYRLGNMDDPQIGDVRVKFDYVPDGPATIMALQTVVKGSATFAPYRSISRGFCCYGISREMQRKRLIDESGKTRDDLYEANKIDCGILYWWCCCYVFVCNVVRYMFTAYNPEIFHMSPGKRTARECIGAVRDRDDVKTWAIWSAGCAMLLIGTYAWFSLLVVFPEAVPFLAPALRRSGDFVAVVLATYATPLIWALLTAAAYLQHRPRQAVLYLLIAGALVALPMVVASSVLG